MFIVCIMVHCRWREAYLAKQLTLPMGGRSVDHMKSLPVSQRHYCCHCELLLSHEDLTSHDGHDMISSITDIQLEMPTLMLMPVDDKKSQAVRIIPLLFINIILHNNYSNISSLMNLLIFSMIH